MQAFLKGGGEMGALTREYDWSSSPVGTPDTWPRSLCTTLGILLHTSFPMFLFWGKELTCFYNDAYRVSLGTDGKHSAVGKNAREVWGEIWEFIGPMISDVLENGQSFWFEDQLVPIYRNGRIEDVYWTFSYSPVYDDDDQIGGVLVTCNETTAKVADARELQESRDMMQFALDAVELGTWDLNPETNKFTANARLKDWFGLQPDDQIPLDLALSAIVPKDRARVQAAIGAALEPASGGHYEAEYTIVNPKSGEERIVLAKGRARFDAAGKAYRFNGTLEDVTQAKLAAASLAEARQLADLAIRTAGLGVFEFDVNDSTKTKYSPEFAYILTGNAGKSHVSRDIFASHLHPEDIPLRLAALDSVVKLGTFSYEPRMIWEDGSVHRVLVTGGAIYDRDGAVTAISGTVKDITEMENQTKAGREALERSEARFRSLVEEAPVATCLFVGPELSIEVANKIMLSFWGKGCEVIGKPLRQAIPELEGQPFFDILEEVYRTGKAYEATATMARLPVNGVMGDYYFDFTYKPLRDVNGEVYAIMEMAVNVTEQVLVRQTIEENRQQLLASFEQAPVAIAFISSDELTFRMANPFYAALVGREVDDILGKPLLEALPELQGQGFDRLLEQVIGTSTPYIANEVAVQLLRKGIMETIYVNLNYQPLQSVAGSLPGVLVVATDVTQQVIARRKIEESEAKFRALIEEAPVATCLFVGPEMRVEVINEMMVQYWGKDFSVINKSLIEALPELEGQPFLEILASVYESGETYSAKAARVDLVVDGTLGTYYFDFTYKPLLNEAGAVYGIIDVSIDVTAQVAALRELEAAESALRGAIELAELATWSLDIRSRVIRYSQRFMDWLGFSEDTKDLDTAYIPLPDGYRESVPLAIEAAIAKGPRGRYENEHPIINRTTGQLRIIHAQAEVICDEEGNPVFLSGTAQDVTEQRNIRLSLEQQVHERTEQLATINEELQAANEELAESNSQLLHSNEELAQYAYVASHDLQEPLRKIRMFSGMLEQQPMSEEQQVFTRKIVQSAERMSLLIRDLLNFSRLLHADTLVQPVNLDDIVRAVAGDFELVIQEKHASLHIDRLPVIQGIALQMNQLFYNLIGNALKFSKPDETPDISVTAERISQETAAKYIHKPFSFANYYHIQVRDNGIGFDTKYADQIFEVFKRLHGREVYPGSGIGLALCKRIVANHFGELFASSSAGSGSTFHLILPDRQQDDRMA